MPTPVRLFHITAIDNLNAIFKAGGLFSKNHLSKQNQSYQDIAHTGAQSKRASKAVIDPPGGELHDYVPFYFAPRSPMLMAIDRGNVKGCDLKQSDILHIEMLVRTAHNAGAEYVFYDRNATKFYSEAYTDPHQLHAVIAWDLLTEPPTLDGFCKFFQDKHDDLKYVDRMEKRQAEFLVKNHVPLIWFKRIGVINKTKKNEVECLIHQHGLNLTVDIVKDWYFLN